MLRKHGRIVIAGNLVEDVVTRLPGEIDWGVTTMVDRIEHHLGGNGAATSYAAAMMGARVRLMGAVGPDGAAERVLAKLAEAGVDLSAIERREERTAATVVLVSANGARSLLHAPGVSREVFSEPYDFGGEPGHFHLANIFSLPQMRRTGPEWLARAARAGWSTSLDTGHDTKNEWMRIVEPCLPHLDLLFANDAEARAIAGCQDLTSAARIFLEKGAKTVVIKRGGEGCTVFDGAGERTTPGFRIDVVDTTGAGDCFVGGFLAALDKGGTIDEAARLGNACGALSASAVGGVTGLQRYQETLAWMQRHSTHGH